MNDPQLIIADEPTGNIDPELSYEIVDLLKGINDQGTTILMVTHEHDLVRHFGGRIINITDGEIVFDEVILGANEEMLLGSEPEFINTSETSGGYQKPDAAQEDLSSMLSSGEDSAFINAADDILLPPDPISEMSADDVIAAITGEKTSGGAGR